MSKNRIISSYLNLRWLVKSDGSRTLQQHVLIYEKMDKAKIKPGKTHQEAQEWIDVPEIEEAKEEIKA